MITQYEISLHAQTQKTVSPDSAYRLYAWLLEHLQKEDAQWLHQEGTSYFSQWIHCNAQPGLHLWKVCLFSSELSPKISKVFENSEEITLEGNTLNISHVEKNQLTGEDFILQGQATINKKATLHFLTPTAFKQQGKYVIFPQERLILQSLLSRWNAVFPQYPMTDSDAFDAVLAGLRMVDYHLRSTRFTLKGITIPGFTGKCKIDARLSPALLNLWNTLLLFGHYSGIGMKTGLGMGGVQVEKSNK